MKMLRWILKYRTIASDRGFSVTERIRDQWSQFSLTICLPNGVTLKNALPSTILRNHRFCMIK
jgi:hypothetical protein